MTSIECIDVDLTKRQVIKLCKKSKVLYESKQNINGGRLIQTYLNEKDDFSNYIRLDIYYKCNVNNKLYKKSRNVCNKEKLFELIRNSIGGN